MSDHQVNLRWAHVLGQMRDSKKRADAAAEDEPSCYQNRLNAMRRVLTPKNKWVLEQLGEPLEGPTTVIDPTTRGRDWRKEDPNDPEYVDEY